MEYKVLKKDLEALRKNIKQELKFLLATIPHYQTGALYRSIQCRLEWNGKNVIFQIEGLKYLMYLEGGRFLKDFVKEKQREIKEVTKRAIKADIELELRNPKRR